MSSNTLLIVDDDKTAFDNVKDTIEGVFEQLGIGSIDTVRAKSVAEATKILDQDERQELPMILVDIQLGVVDGHQEFGMELLDQMKHSRDPRIYRTVLYSTFPQRIQDEKLLVYAESGVADVWGAPLTDVLIRDTVAEFFNVQPSVPDRAALDAAANGGFSKIVGHSFQICRTLSDVLKIAPSDCSVLLLGESGTGKEVIARAIHELSGARSEKSFLPINVAGLATSKAGLALRTELDGCEKAAIGPNNPTKYSPGIFERVEGGTVFLDEIGEITPDAAASLLRTLSEFQVLPFVANSPKTVPAFRLICATDKALPSLVDAGEFDDALFYRIADEELSLPPLRKRGADILLLADHFFKEQGLSHVEMTWGAKVALLSARLPGNVRALDSVCGRIVRRIGSRRQITRQDVVNALPANIGFSGAMGDALPTTIEGSIEQLLTQTIQCFGKRGIYPRIEFALLEALGDIRGTSREELGFASDGAFRRRKKDMKDKLEGE